jgi:hypothetical protein
MPEDDGNDSRWKHEEEEPEDKTGERLSARLSRTDVGLHRARDRGDGIRRRRSATQRCPAFAAELRSVNIRRTALAAKNRSPP